MQAGLIFMTAKEAAEHWGISQRRVSILCSEGRIPNISTIGNMWVIPKETAKPVDARHLRKKIEPAKPFLKWAGGKGQLLSTIIAKLPNEFGKTITKYAEPFVGGGAILFEVLQKYNIKEAYISDINEALIATYRQIKTNVDGLVMALERLQDEYLPLCEVERKEYYYGKREQFNELNLGNQKNEQELAALFIFLNKTCFNGLYRVNRKNKYNVPMGDYKKPLICDESNLHAVSRLLQKVVIVAGDYTESQEFIDSNTFVYIDPPYRPLSQTASFTSYSKDGFGDSEQKQLAEYAKILSQKGAKILLSNSDPKNIDANNNFFDELYKEFNITRVNAKRIINSNAECRGKIKELLISNY